MSYVTAHNIAHVHTTCASHTVLTEVRSLLSHAGRHSQLQCTEGSITLNRRDNSARRRGGSRISDWGGGVSCRWYVLHSPSVLSFLLQFLPFPSLFSPSFPRIPRLTCDFLPFPFPSLAHYSEGPSQSSYGVWGALWAPPASSGGARQTNDAFWVKVTVPC